MASEDKDFNCQHSRYRYEGLCLWKSHQMTIQRYQLGRAAHRGTLLSVGIGADLMVLSAADCFQI